VAVGRALRAGKLKKLPCEKCGSMFSEAHHDDYDKPLDVRWLCRVCHEEEHGGPGCQSTKGRVIMERKLVNGLQWERNLKGLPGEWRAIVGGNVVKLYHDAPDPDPKKAGAGHVWTLDINDGQKTQKLEADTCSKAMVEAADVLGAK
jgi:ribosomal protein S27AE